MHYVKPQYWMLALQTYDENGNPIECCGMNTLRIFDRRWSLDHVINEAINIGRKNKYNGIIVYEDSVFNSLKGNHIVYHTSL